ncbi:GSCOCG00012413001-RA-CDS, partial [Cotesia congregata]
MRGEELIKVEKAKQERERWEKIWDSNSIREYKYIKRPGLPEYLKKDWGKERWRRIARFRLGDYLKGYRYWEEKESRICNVCGVELETWEHVWEVCSGWGVEKGWQEMRGQVLGGEGQGEIWLKEIE